MVSPESTFCTCANSKQQLLTKAVSTRCTNIYTGTLRHRDIISEKRNVILKSKVNIITCTELTQGFLRFFLIFPRVWCWFMLLETDYCNASIRQLTINHSTVRSITVTGQKLCLGLIFNSIYRILIVIRAF